MTDVSIVRERYRRFANNEAPRRRHDLAGRDLLRAAYSDFNASTGCTRVTRRDGR